MPSPSTSLWIALLVAACLAGLALGLWLRRAAPADPRQTYLLEHATRLFLAQHWARGGALSLASEAWRPCLTALGSAALAVQSQAELAALLAELVEKCADDPELANIWEQARGELAGTKRREWEPLEGLNPIEREAEIRVSLGKTTSGGADWNYPELGNRARSMVLSACLSARKLLAVRRVPSVPPPG